MQTLLRVAASVFVLLLVSLGTVGAASAFDNPEGPEIDGESIYRQWRIYPERTEGFRATLTRQHITYVIGEGQYRRELEPPDFYRALGEHDLAPQSRVGSISRSLAVGLGSSVLMGGIGGVFNHFSDEPHSLGSVVFMGALYFPIGALIGSLFFLRERHPVDVNQRHQLMDQYNRSLSTEVGVEQ